MKIEDYDLETHVGRISACISFQPDIMMRLEAVRGRINRSMYINRALDKIMSIDEEKIWTKS